jgi:5,10-methylenetetrahydromethanopterin reductase
MAVERGIGVCLLSATPIQAFVKVAQLADEVGLHSMWMAEGYHFFRDVGEPRSATTVAAAVALATRRIKLGLGIVPAHTRHPALLAMEAVALSELSGGRFILGLGAAKAAALHMGYTSDTLKPVPAHRDAINIVRAIFNGEAFDYRGKTFSFDAPARRADEPLPNVPIAIGATGPLMLKLGGALADIVLLPTFTTPAYVRYARGEMAKGAAETGRNVDDIPIGATLPFSVDEDSRAAHDAIRRLVAVYITNKVTNIKNDTLMSAAGMGADEAVPIAKAATEKGVEAATAMVTDEMIDKVAIAGNPDEVTAKLLALLREGLTLPLMYQVLGPDRERAIRLVAEAVQPAFLRA